MGIYATRFICIFLPGHFFVLDHFQFSVKTKKLICISYSVGSHCFLLDTFELACWDTDDVCSKCQSFTFDEKI